MMECHGSLLAEIRLSFLFHLSISDRNFLNHRFTHFLFFFYIIDQQCFFASHINNTYPVSALFPFFNVFNMFEVMFDFIPKFRYTTHIFRRTRNYIMKSYICQVLFSNQTSPPAQ